mmetsp:Transcript_5753/g.19619  ORF Transcript_5753/g.19619 Transcript_5753/m.19619 type:complete len:228 (-) Transcript_5753:97-780(-)
MDDADDSTTASAASAAVRFSVESSARAWCGGMYSERARSRMAGDKPNFSATSNARLSRHSPSSTVHECVTSPSSSDTRFMRMRASPTPKSSTTCRCVEKNPRHPRKCNTSRSAPANLAPSSGSVPRPNSSTMTRLLAVACFSIASASFSSIPHELIPSAGLSAVAIRRKYASKRGTTAEVAGTRRPQLARRATAAVARKSVDFPLMFGPVRRTSWSSANVFASTTGS